MLESVLQSDSRTERGRKNGSRSESASKSESESQSEARVRATLVLLVLPQFAFSLSLEPVTLPLTRLQIRLNLHLQLSLISHVASPVDGTNKTHRATRWLHLHFTLFEGSQELFHRTQITAHNHCTYFAVCKLKSELPFTPHTAGLCEVLCKWSLFCRFATLLFHSSPGIVTAWVR